MTQTTGESMRAHPFRCNCSFIQSGPQAGVAYSIGGERESNLFAYWISDHFLEC